MVPLGKVAELIRGITFRKSDQLESATEDSLLVATTKAAQESGIVYDALYHIPRSLLKDDRKLLRPGDILISTANSLRLLGRTTHVYDVRDPISFGAFMSVIRPNTRVLDTYLIRCLRTEFASDFFFRNANTTTNISNLNLRTLAEFRIPLPPLAVQQEIVAEIEGYQQVIDGARAVVESYRPRIVVDPEWPLVELGDICEVKGGKRLPRGEQFSTIPTQYPYIRVVDFWEQSVKVNDMKYISKDVHQKITRYTISSGDVYISIAGNIGLMGMVPESLNGANLTENAAKLVPDVSKIKKEYLATIGNSDPVQLQIRSLTHAVGVPKLALRRIKMLRIPLPPIATQQAIVAEIEAEQALVAANRELIERFERKIEAAIARVWGEG